MDYDLFVWSSPFLGVVKSASFSTGAGIVLSAAGDLDLDLFLFFRGAQSAGHFCSCVPHGSCFIRWILENDKQRPSMHQVFDCNWRDPLSFAHCQLTCLTKARVMRDTNFTGLGQELLGYARIMKRAVFGCTLSLQVEHTIRHWCEWRLSRACNHMPRSGWLVKLVCWQQQIGGHVKFVAKRLNPCYLRHQAFFQTMSYPWIAKSHFWLLVPCLKPTPQHWHHLGPVGFILQQPALCPLVNVDPWL